MKAAVMRMRRKRREVKTVVGAFLRRRDIFLNFFMNE